MTNEHGQPSYFLGQLKAAYQSVGVVNDLMCLDALRGLRPPLNPVEIDRICEILREQVKSWEGRDPGKIQALHNWIRFRRWEDRQPAKPVQPTAADRVKKLQEGGHI